jgi:hypothetical protein
MVHELGPEQTKTMKELLDIATRHTSSVEAVEAIFIQSGSKAVPSDSQGTSAIATDKGTKRSIKTDKRGPRRWPQRITIGASCDEEMNDKDAGNSDEEIMVTVEHDFKRPTWSTTDHFKNLLEATCLNLTFPVKHKLKECSMIKKYMATRNLARVKKPKGDSVGKVAAPFPEEKAAMSIYIGPAPHESHQKHKLIGRVINSIRAATPEYLCCSKFLITFDQTDHPDSIPKPGRFPLIVNHVVRTTRLTKALNLMYLGTFKGLGLTPDQLQSSPDPFHGVVPGKHFVPLGWVTLPFTFGDASNYRMEMLTFKVVDLSGLYHIILGWPCYFKFMAIQSYPGLRRQNRSLYMCAQDVQITHTVTL